MPKPVGARPLPERARIVILRALPGLGDWLCAVPTIRALRRARPGAELHLVGLAPTRSLVERFAGGVDVFHDFPGWPGLPERRPAIRELPGFLADMQALEADLAIQLHGAGDRTNEITELLGARAVAGFYRAGERCPDPARFLQWHDEDPEVRRGLRLLHLLGLGGGDETIDFPLDPAARPRARRLLAEAAVEGPYAIVHPGASRPAARWTEAGFREVGGRLAAAGRRVLVTGTVDERMLTARVAAAIPDAVDLGGRTDLDDLGWLLREADLLVSNDTGVSHLAAALRVRSVIVFTGASVGGPRRWAPLDTTRHRAVPPSVPTVVAEASRALRRLERLERAS